MIKDKGIDATGCKSLLYTCHHWHSPFWLTLLKNNISFLRLIFLKNNVLFLRFISFYRFSPQCIWKKSIFLHCLHQYSSLITKAMLEHDSFVNGITIYNITNVAYQIRTRKMGKSPPKETGKICFFYKLSIILSSNIIIHVISCARAKHQG